MSDSGDQSTVGTDEPSGGGRADGPDGSTADVAREGDDATAETGEQVRETDEAVGAARAHLRDVEDGCGCAEVWEHLSDRRED